MSILSPTAPTFPSTPAMRTRPTNRATAHRLTRWTVAAVAIVLLAACGKKESASNPTQVAARVGKSEISVHQINQVLSRTNVPNATPQAIEALRKDVLEKLIDQQLAVDQAEEKKLNRSPEVVAALEAARREVLARAYAQNVTGGIARPTPEEVKKYFTEHPQLFSERRVYNLQELLVPTGGDATLATEAKAQVAAGKSVEDVANWLRSRNIKFGGGGATRTAEQIPLEVLGRLHSMKDGQVIVLDNPQGFTVLRIAASQSAPIPEATATPRIEQFLANQRGAEALALQVKQLRASTEVTYMGDFAKSAGTPAAAAAPAAAVTTDAPAAAPVAPNVLAAPSAVPATGGVPDDKARAAIEKGAAGLK